MATVYIDLVATGRTLITTNLVLSELIALLTARVRAARADVLAFIAAIRADPQVHVVHVDPTLDAEAWDLLGRTLDKEWSHVDAASFIVMRRLGLAEAFTTDRHFSQAGFVRLPGE